MGTSQSRQAVDDGAGSESAQTPAVEGASGGDVAGQPPQQVAFNPIFSADCICDAR